MRAGARRPRRVGIVGYGLAGRVFHAPLVKATAGLTLAGVVTSDAGRAGQAARDTPDALVTDDVRRFLSGAHRVDVLVVAAANAAHVAIARSAIEAAIPVVVDKPLAPTSEDARRLVEGAEAAGVMLTVFHNRRWDGDFLTLRHVVESGRLGRVHRFESRFERWAPALRQKSWREDPDPAQGAGLLLDLGSHLVDQAILLFGPVTAVAAQIDRRRRASRVDDDVVLALTHAGGVRSHLWASAVAALPGPRFRALGDEAGFVSYGLDPQEQQLKDGLGPGDPGFGVAPDERAGVIGAGDAVRPVPLQAGAYQEFYAGLVRALDGAGPVPVDPWDAVAVLDILEAARAPTDGDQRVSSASARRSSASNPRG